MGFLDAYIIRARLFPAILAVSPFIALMAITVRWDSFGLPQTITTLAIGVLLFATSDLARRKGKRVEQKLFEDTGGRPSNDLLLHRDGTFDAATKARYRSIASDLLGEKPPGRRKESENLSDARNYFLRLGAYVREHTRDTKRFRLLFEENITYGFRRNLYGLKWAALSLNIAVVVVCVSLLYVNRFSASVITQVQMVGAFAAVHAVYFLFVVTERSVRAASDLYARQLVLSLEQLADQAKKK